MVSLGRTVLLNVDEVIATATSVETSNGYPVLSVSVREDAAALGLASALRWRTVCPAPADPTAPLAIASTNAEGQAPLSRDVLPRVAPMVATLPNDNAVNPPALDWPAVSAAIGIAPDALQTLELFDTVHGTTLFAQSSARASDGSRTITTRTIFAEHTADSLGVRASTRFLVRLPGGQTDAVEFASVARQLSSRFELAAQETVYYDYANSSVLALPAGLEQPMAVYAAFPAGRVGALPPRRAATAGRAVLPFLPVAQCRQAFRTNCDRLGWFAAVQAERGQAPNGCMGDRPLHIAICDRVGERPRRYAVRPIRLSDSGIAPLNPSSATIEQFCGQYHPLSDSSTLVCRPTESEPEPDPSLLRGQAQRIMAGRLARHVVGQLDLRVALGRWTEEAP